MPTVKFYHDAEGVFFFENRTAKPGSIEIVKINETHINFQLRPGEMYFTENITPAQVLDKDGLPTYSSYEDIIEKNSNFFR